VRGIGTSFDPLADMRRHRGTFVRMKGDAGI
jgi:hypothetical protein